MDYARKNIPVSCEVLGTIDSTMLRDSRQLSTDPVADRRALAENHPIGCLGRPEYVALAVVWLAFEESCFTMSSMLHMDGGLLAQL